VPRLRSIELSRVAGAVRGLAGAAAGQARREGLRVCVVDDDGVAGLGEASPLPGYSPDTLAQCEAQLRAVDAAALGPAGDGPAAAWVARVLDGAGLSAPAARFGLETALLDWLGRRRGRSLASLLDGPEATQRRVPLSALVPDLAAARAAFDRGVRAFKLKISPATFDDDLRLARALRDVFGAAVALRFDANGRLAPDEALAQLRALAALDPEFVEEPLAAPALLEIAASPVPLAADESLAQPGAWPAVAAVCRVLVLKPTVLGGALACLALARDASARGLATTVTHTFDGPIALAAAAELAAALPGEVRACGLDRHGGLDAWPPIAIPQLHGDHVASANRPGLGLVDA
jgi:o-succinylbenzoate synthase